MRWVEVLRSSPRNSRRSSATPRKEVFLSSLSHRFFSRQSRCFLRELHSLSARTHDDVLEVIFAKLAPPDLFSALTVFSFNSRFKPLAARLMQSSLKRNLDEALKTFQDSDTDFTIDDIFP